MNLRPNWPVAFGPGDMPMPNDGPGVPLGHWGEHEDSEDCLNRDGTWGPLAVGSPGGSGIVMGYSVSDLDIVLKAEAGCAKRRYFYDWEHWIRQIRYSIAAWEMTHDPKFARRIVSYDTLATGAYTDDPGTIHLDDPGWVPSTLAQYHAMAQQKPHTGLPWNCRAVGWIAYGRLMRHKCDRSVTRNWINMLLETCELAAMPGTGQQGWFNSPGDPLHGFTYTFHEAILVHAVLCACRRLKLAVPSWVLAWMHAVESAPTIEYPVGSGCASPLSYWKTSGGILTPYVGPLQHGDPAHGWWGTNCAVLEKLVSGWAAKAGRYGPTEATDEQSRKETMLMRGLAAA